MTRSVPTPESPSPPSARGAYDPRPVDAVPGIGPGVAWLLARAGARTVGDLAQADPVSLTLRLGLVGRMVDVRQAQMLAARTPTPQTRGR
jgi:predicted flap endonuclease-1-like 5' DNA nuclease